MKIVHRFGFYMGGFSIGLVFLMFFLSGKKTSCAYGPDARVLKNIQTKRPQYSESVQEQLNSKIKWMKGLSFPIFIMSRNTYDEYLIQGQLS